MFGEKENNNVVKIDISYNLVVKAILFIFGFAFLFLIRDIIGMLLISILLTTAIGPFVDLIHKKKKMPRWVGITIVYVGIIGVCALVVGMLFPAIIKEFKTLIDKLPYFYQSLATQIDGIQSIAVQDALKEYLLGFAKGALSKIQTGSGDIFKSFGNVISGFTFFFITLVITFYMTMEEDGPTRLVKALVPKKWHHYALNLMVKIQNIVGGWLKGQLSLSLIIGSMCYIALIIMGVNYSLLLALLAAITEAIPYVGPLIGAVPAVFIAFTQSPVKGIAVTIIYVLIQQMENNFIVPKVMKKSVGLNPIVVIIVIMIGVKLAGFAGALLAIPFTAIIQVIASEFFHLEQDGIFKEKENNKEEVNIIGENK